MIGLDIFGWTVVAGVAAVAAVILSTIAIAVTLILHWMVRRRKATVWIEEEDDWPGGVPALRVMIRNDGEPELNIAQPAVIVPDPRTHPNAQPIQFEREKVDDGNTRFPRRLRTEDEMISRIVKSQLADELWMRDCIDSCRVRGVYLPKRGRPFESPLFDVPVDAWLPADATARQIKPRP